MSSGTAVSSGVRTSVVCAESASLAPSVVAAGALSLVLPGVVTLAAMGAGVMTLATLGTSGFAALGSAALELATARTGVVTLAAGAALARADD